MKKSIGLIILFLALSAMLSLTASATAPARPIVSDGTLKTSDNKLIRAGVAWYGKCYADPTSRSEDPKYWQRTKDVGLNAIRVTNWDERSFNGTIGADCTEVEGEQKGGWAIADNLSHLDIMVQHAKDNGLYLIITPGDTPGTFNKNYLTQFWSVAADRYKDETHVIYEITNEPVKWRPSDYSNANLNDLAAVYQIMRAAAPNTPILNLSFSHADESMNAKVASFTTKAGIVWANGKDIVSFHTYGTPNLQYIKSLRDDYPVMNTEWGFPGQGGVVSLSGNKYQGQALEENGISWMSFQAGRADGEFTRYYDFANDAKLKGYYWIPGTTTTDSLNDWTKVDSYSANMQFANGNPSYFSGDTSRATRTDTNTGYITYKASGIGQFKANIYSHDSFSGIKFYVSHNGTDWEPLPTTHTTPAATTAGWSHSYYSSTDGLPSGTEYLKIELASTTDFFVTQISDVEVTNWAPVWEYEDNLTAWSVVDSKSSNWKFATANPAYFDGDDSRAIRTDTNTGYVTYKQSNLGGFYANIYFQTNDGIQFYSSSDGLSWTPVAVTMDTPVATSGGWKGTYFRNTNALASGTQYIKVEFSSTISNNVTQLANMKIWTSY
ncbi:glycoside hydrolase family 5 protein [Paenibacillus radicis (ex Xue et al. 2023)]|uniref:Glycoside hydrolase family 5 protein n=1 Tax=Paenibacillus radicis (ex Xue et al. 2023) TaxID=2972489 RepID=A0ABT1YH24_9BACL|nr:glycoside hydrolase family 5 protein [Paenibacillus radicis (ex Xue et al. 2023)]MCR8632262.1 glycoside hydrolase family 5 protein [Paenibacillus radicis (ex Xue et al. 2023)]